MNVDNDLALEIIALQLRSLHCSRDHAHFVAWDTRRYLGTKLLAILCTFHLSRTLLACTESNLNVEPVRFTMVLHPDGAFTTMSWEEYAQGISYSVDLFLNFYWHCIY